MGSEPTLPAADVLERMHHEFIPDNGLRMVGKHHDFKPGLPADESWTNLFWGASGDVPVPGDYNGDSQTDVAVYRPSNGAWYVYGGTSAFSASPGVPQPGDYNGDGSTDLATYEPSSGLWAVPGGATKLWGQPGDVPLVLPYAIRNAFFPPVP